MSKRKNTPDEEPENPLSLSFLDALSCGLAATLALFLIFVVLPHGQTAKDAIGNFVGQDAEESQVGLRTRSMKETPKTAPLAIYMFIAKEDVENGELEEGDINWIVGGAEGKNNWFPFFAKINDNSSYAPAQQPTTEEPVTEVPASTEDILSLADDEAPPVQPEGESYDPIEEVNSLSKGVKSWRGRLVRAEASTEDASPADVYVLEEVSAPAEDVVPVVYTANVPAALLLDAVPAIELAPVEGNLDNDVIRIGDGFVSQNPPGAGSEAAPPESAPRPSYEPAPAEPAPAASSASDNNSKSGYILGGFTLASSKKSKNVTLKIKNGKVITKLNVEIIGSATMKKQIELDVNFKSKVAASSSNNKEGVPVLAIDRNKKDKWIMPQSGYKFIDEESKPSQDSQEVSNE